MMDVELLFNLIHTRVCDELLTRVGANESAVWWVRCKWGREGVPSPSNALPSALSISSTYGSIATHFYYYSIHLNAAYAPYLSACIALAHPLSRVRLAMQMQSGRRWEHFLMSCVAWGTPACRQWSPLWLPCESYQVEPLTDFPHLSPV